MHFFLPVIALLPAAAIAPAGAAIALLPAAAIAGSFLALIFFGLPWIPAVIAVVVFMPPALQNAQSLHCDSGGRATRSVEAARNGH